MTQVESLLPEDPDQVRLTRRVAIDISQSKEVLYNAGMWALGLYGAWLCWG